MRGRPAAYDYQHEAERESSPPWLPALIGGLLIIALAACFGAWIDADFAAFVRSQP